MRPTSARFDKALQASHRRATIITCTPPGDETIVLPWNSCRVRSTSSRGSRWTADLTVTPVPGRDLYSLLSLPGARFTVRHGIDFGGGDVELLDLGVYEADEPGADMIGGLISLGLRDLWGRVERCRFTTPYTPPTNSRAGTIATAVQAAIPGQQVDILANGGSIDGKTTWDRDRTQLITDLARDGALDVGFDGAGRLRIAQQPILNPEGVVWTYRTGEYGNITTADRKRPLDRLYNTVVVIPADDSQTWSPQTVSVTDPDHPLHPDKVGVVPFFWASPTIKTAAAAKSAANAMLQKVLGNTETVTITGVGHPGQEVGDNVNVLIPASDIDPGFNAVHLVEGVDLDCATGGMNLSTRSNTIADIEEAA